MTVKSPLRVFANKQRGGEGKVFHVEVLDASGGEIRCSFFNEVADQFYEKLQIGRCYTFSRGSVKVANRQYNTCNHRYELVFDKAIQCEEAADGEKIENVKFSLVDLRILQSKNLPCTVDLCGILTSAAPAVSFTSKEGKLLVKREVVIADDTAATISVTLWGERAQQPDAIFEGQPVVALKGVLVKEWQSGRSGSLLEAGHLVFRPDLPAAQKVQEWWSQGGSSQSLMAMSITGTIGARAPQGRQVDFGALRDLGQSVGEQAELFTVYCRLAAVQTRKQGEVQPLTFMACMETKENNRPCNRKVDSDGFCALCNKAGKSGPRFNLRCRFSDFADNAWLTTFHEPAQSVVGMTAEEAVAIEAGHGRDALENSFKSRYFSQLLQVSVRAKLDSYNGEIRTNITAIDARPVKRVERGRQMLAEIHEMLEKGSMFY